MANHSHHRNAVYGFALIGLGVLVHYAWAWAPPDHQAQVWNACGAAGRLLGWCAAGLLIGSRVGWLVVLWLACEECLVIGCSVAYIVSPWTVPAGQAQCSSLLQFDLGRAGILVAVLILCLAVRVDTSQRNERGG